MMADECGKAVVIPLIEKAIDSTAPEVDPRLLKAIKLTVRSSDHEIRFAAQTLLSLMKRDHSQVRYLSLTIIDELFMRSKLFRNLIVENLDQLLTLSVGFRRNLPLPAPASVASVLRAKAIEFLEKWNDSFGLHYRRLRLGYDYLKNTLRFQFPNLQANAARIQQERREREMRTKEILLKKVEYLKVNLPSIKEEIMSTVDEVNECLHILRTEEEEDMPLATADDEEMEEFRNSELRQIRHDSLREGENIQESSENKIVFDALRELYKVLVTKHLAAIQEWISCLIRVDMEDYRFRDSALKDFIDIRNTIQLAKRKCEDSGFALPANAKAEEEDIWEDGSLQVFDSRNSGSSYPERNNETFTSKTDNTRETEGNNKLSDGSMRRSDNSENKVNSFRGKLLAEAPVLDWGSFLDNWGSDREFFSNQRGLDLDSHWGRVDDYAAIPAEKIAELNLQKSVYEEEPVEIRACRAPLRNGQLCQRRDLRVCPFHGIIIPRDQSGNPVTDSVIQETDSQTEPEEISPDVGNVSVEELLRQAVKNVKERDREEVRRNQSDKHALKRARLAKVREHNAAVLRKAAMASTSRSSHVGEEMETDYGSRPSAKSKKQTLASMLKKKENTKDRISQRLLSTGQR